MIINQFIKKDITSHKFIFLILCIGMLPIWLKGYACYILILLAPLLLKTQYNVWSILILIFSCLYTFSVLNSDAGLTPSSFIFYCFYPIIIFQTGIYVSHNIKYSQTCFLLIVCMSVCLAIPAIIINISDFKDTGEIVNISRSIEFDKESSRAATGYGMMLSIMCGCLGTILLQTKTKFDKSLKIFIIVISFLALFGTIHLLNRTAIVLSVISLIVACVLPPFKTKHIAYMVIVISLMTAIYMLFFRDSGDTIMILESYADRDQGSGSNATLGGRTEIYALSIEQMFSQPFGNPNGLENSRYSHAHNIILDGGLRSGIIGFVILLLIFIEFIKLSEKFFFKNRQFTDFEKKTLILINITVVLQCMVEPVIEGLPQYFWFFLFCFGILTQVTKSSTDTRKLTS